MKKIRSELTQDADDKVYGLVIWLGTKSEGAARIKAQRLIRTFNSALKPKSKQSKADSEVKK